MHFQSKSDPEDCRHPLSKRVEHEIQGTDTVHEFCRMCGSVREILRERKSTYPYIKVTIVTEWAPGSESESVT